MEEILYTIMVAIAFLIPGFIITSITKRIIPSIDKDYKTKILENFIYSFINIFIWAIPIYSIYINRELWEKNYILLWIIMFLIIFVTPLTISLIIIAFNKYDIIRKICIHLQITSTDVEASAWDFKFKQIENEWVIITLNNNKVIRGFIGKYSYISSNPRERDIYIDKVYMVNEQQEWIKKEGTDGILIKAEEIKSIEFFDYDKEVKDERIAKNTKRKKKT